MNTIEIVFDRETIPYKIAQRAVIMGRLHIVRIRQTPSGFALYWYEWNDVLRQHYTVHYTTGLATCWVRYQTLYLARWIAYVLCGFSLSIEVR